MTTRYPTGNVHVAYTTLSAVAYTTLSAHEREDLKAGDEVVVLVNYGKHALRERVTKRTDKQVTLTNGSRYSIRTGDKIGSAESYNAPHIVGRPLYTAGEAAQLNAAIAAAAEKAAENAELEDILDRALKIAEGRGVALSEVFGDLHDLNTRRSAAAARERLAGE